jgi:hypothetical protein
VADACEPEGPAASMVAWCGTARAMAAIMEVPKGLRQPDPILRLEKTTVQVTPCKVGKSGKIPFVADSACNVTVIRPADLNMLGLKVKDLDPRLRPQAPNQADGRRGGLKGAGAIRAELQFRGRQILADVYIMEGLAQPLLSRDHAVRLGIITVATDRGVENL